MLSHPHDIWSCPCVFKIVIIPPTRSRVPGGSRRDAQGGGLEEPGLQVHVHLPSRLHEPRDQGRPRCRVISSPIAIEEFISRFGELGVITRAGGSPGGGASLLLMLEEGYYEMAAHGEGIVSGFTTVTSIESWLHQKDHVIGYETERDAAKMLERHEVGFVLCPPPSRSVMSSRPPNRAGSSLRRRRDTSSQHAHSGSMYLSSSYGTRRSASKKPTAGYRRCLRPSL